ncbi:hypothetical protein CF319_g6074 [Tilletia indica]|nr:hypothetical protein CF319_g6074 [Tilletia indica]
MSAAHGPGRSTVSSVVVPSVAAAATVVAMSATVAASQSQSSTSSSSSTTSATTSTSASPSNFHPPSKAQAASPSPSNASAAAAGGAGVGAAASSQAFLSVRSGVFGLPTLGVASDPVATDPKVPSSYTLNDASPSSSSSALEQSSHVEQDHTLFHNAAAHADDHHDANEVGGAHKSAEEEKDDERAMSRQFMMSYFIAGGAAGAASRTVVSPLERLKILQQIQPAASRSGGAGGRGAAYSGVWQGLVKMGREEGFRGYMRGNATNCIRIAPYSAVQFTTYEALKDYLKDPVTGQLNNHRKLTAGALAGIASVVSTYPLDLVRSRISIASASLFDDSPKLTASSSPDARARIRAQIAERQRHIPGIWAMSLKVYREEGGWRGLYRGCIATSAGVAPYVSLNFYVYEALRARFVDENGDISTVVKLGCGGVAGTVSQTLTYPLDVLRRRMQMAGMKDERLGFKEKTSWAVMGSLFKAEGVRGLYRGLFSNLLKVAPSIATSFTVYETVQQMLEPKHHHHHH